MAENMKYDFTIETLGTCKVHSPIELSTRHGEFRANYVEDSTFVLNKINKIIFMRSYRFLCRSYRFFAHRAVFLYDYSRG